MISLNPATETKLSTGLKRAIHDHWGLFLAEGITLVVLGLAAIMLPPIAGLATTVILGWLLLVAGAAGLFFTWRTRSAPGHIWSLLSACAAILAGAVLLWNPLQGLVTLTYVLTAYFIVDGIFMIFLGIEHRRELSGKWEWLLINGLVDLVLAGIIISGMPSTLFWALGLLVGIDLVFGGFTMISMALAARKDSKQAVLL